MINLLLQLLVSAMECARDKKLHIHHTALFVAAMAGEAVSVNAVFSRLTCCYKKRKMSNKKSK